MEAWTRLLSLDLPRGQSAFLKGARTTGKSTLLRTAFPQGLTYDFLKTDLALSFVARPALLREQLIARPTAELNRPIILDEVHWLIEHRRLQFILCGSSGRRLKRGRANLLGGRAWRYEMFPMVTAEFPAAGS